MSKNNQIKALFRNQFAEGDWNEDGTKSRCKKFTCKFCVDCRVDIDSENPKYSSWLGSDSTEVMLVAEAPSASEGVGAFFSGNLHQFFLEHKKSKGFEDLFKFIEENYKTVPYFTDVIKCGAKKQNLKGELSIRRIGNCVSYYLEKEIQIISPKVIFCIGNIAYEQVSRLLKFHRISENIKVVKLLHYSSQANLPLSIKDKINIWKIQAGLVLKEDFDSAILGLDFVSRLKKHLS